MKSNDSFKLIVFFEEDVPDKWHIANVPQRNSDWWNKLMALDCDYAEKEGAKATIKVLENEQWQLTNAVSIKNIQIFVQSHFHDQSLQDKLSMTVEYHYGSASKQITEINLLDAGAQIRGDFDSPSMGDLDLATVIDTAMGNGVADALPCPMRPFKKQKISHFSTNGLVFDVSFGPATTDQHSRLGGPLAGSIEDTIMEDIAIDDQTVPQGSAGGGQSTCTINYIYQKVQLMTHHPTWCPECPPCKPKKPDDDPINPEKRDRYIKEFVKNLVKVTTATGGLYLTYQYISAWYKLPITLDEELAVIETTDKEFIAEHQDTATVKDLCKDIEKNFKNSVEDLAKMIAKVRPNCSAWEMAEGLRAAEGTGWGVLDVARGVIAAAAAASAKNYKLTWDVLVDVLVKAFSLTGSKENVIELTKACLLLSGGPGIQTLISILYTHLKPSLSDLVCGVRETDKYKPTSIVDMAQALYQADKNIGAKPLSLALQASYTKANPPELTKELLYEVLHQLWPSGSQIIVGLMAAYPAMTVQDVLSFLATYQVYPCDDLVQGFHDAAVKVIDTVKGMSALTPYSLLEMVKSVYKAYIEDDADLVFTASSNHDEIRHILIRFGKEKSYQDDQEEYIGYLDSNLYFDEKLACAMPATASKMHPKFSGSAKVVELVTHRKDPEKTANGFKFVTYLGKDRSDTFEEQADAGAEWIFSIVAQPYQDSKIIYAYIRDPYKLIDQGNAGIRLEGGWTWIVDANVWKGFQLQGTKAKLDFWMQSKLLREDRYLNGLEVMILLTKE